MLHHVARARTGQLFHSWEEACTLWALLVAAAPGLTAACLMPNHLHLQHPRDVLRELAAALSGYTRRWNHAHGAIGPMFEPLPQPRDVGDTREKIRRDVRYIHLNPCRAGLVDDPLAWPFSTHRDAVGLAVPPVCRVRPDPYRLHAYVSGDPSVAVGGTELPADRGRYTLDELFCATSAVTRTPFPEVRARGAARALFIASARTCTDATCADIGDYLGISASTARNVPARAVPAVAVVTRVAGDPRFPGLPGGPWRVVKR